MDNFNKILSFVLGLIVVVVFLLVITGRFSLKRITRPQGNNQRINTKTSPTPTIISKKYPSPTPKSIAFNQPKNTQTGNRLPTSIPATGSPTILLPTLFSALSLGFYLRRNRK